MKKNSKKIIILLFIIIISLCITNNNQLSTYNTYAHSGRTDSSGGHHDNNNASGLGSYHYHCGGHPAHLHENGVCPYAPQDIIILEAYEPQMYVGNTQQISYSITSVYSSYGTITSSDNNIVSVLGNSLYANNPGTAIITINSKNNYKQFTITVQPIEVTEIYVLNKNMNIQVGDECEITAYVKPYNATDQSLIFSSSNENIVLVKNSKVVAISEGNADVTITASNGISQTINVNTYIVEPTDIKTSKENLDIEIISTDIIDLSITPSNSNNKDYTITNSDDNIINIVQYDNTIKIEPLNIGKSVITITTWNGISKQIPINVYCIPLQSITIDDNNIHYIFNNIIDLNTDISSLSYNLNPKDATYNEVKWYTSDDNIIEVLNRNKFKINGTGKVVLTCKSTYDSNITSSITLYVINKHIAITILIIIVLIILFCLIIFIKKLNKS